MKDRFHGSACPGAVPEVLANRDQSTPTAVLPYRGCTKSAPRSGTARTAPTWILRAAGHDHSPNVRTLIKLDLGEKAWAGVPCWSGGPQRWARKTVAEAYTRRYETHVRPAMPGNPISLTTLIQVAEARAAFADYRTGRDCRPTNATVAARAGVSIRTVQRAMTALRLLGVATEVLRGRQRTKHERMASWRVGDRGRGWASVWVLHDDRTRVLSPHPEGSLFNQKPSVKKDSPPAAGAKPPVGAPLRGAKAQTPVTAWPVNGSPASTAHRGSAVIARPSPGPRFWPAPKPIHGPHATSTSSSGITSASATGSPTARTSPPAYSATS